MAGARGGLALAFVRLVCDVQPRWFVWENVPGILSSAWGNDFADFLLAFRNIGYHVGYRVLDAQYFGVPQRRRRVFVVGYFGDWRPAAAVLFEPGCLRRDTAAGKKKKAEVAGTFKACAGSDIRPADHVTSAYGGGNTGGEILVSTTLTTHAARIDFDTDTFIMAHTLRGDGHDASEDGTGRQNLVATGRKTLKLTDYRVRRLTPRECERLQGFPDDYTLVPYNRSARREGRLKCADSPRYRALGNSMAVNVMSWIGKRIGDYAAMFSLPAS
jgi:DNA (cytosine-5)-methyltransferase 1